MLSRLWMEGNQGEEEEEEEEEEAGSASWAANGKGAMEMGMAAASSFNPLRDDVEAANWYGGAGEHLLDSSASCSPSSAPAFNNFGGPEVSNYSTPFIPSNPFDLGFESGYFGVGLNLNRDLGGLIGAVCNNDLGFQSYVGSSLNISPQFGCQLGRVGFGELGFGEAPLMQGNPLLFNRPLLLNQLDDNVTSIGSQLQPTLFQKRAASRRNLANINLGYLNGEFDHIFRLQRADKNGEFVGEGKMTVDKNVLIDDGDGDNSRVLRDDGVSLLEESVGNGESSSQANSTVTGDNGNGKMKNGYKAKNLMAERRRRKRLNDRLYMLRSIVPKISKMDRASILGDAVEYLKELTQKINDLQTEMNSNSNSNSTSTASSSFIAPMIKEELSPRAFPSMLSSTTGQPASVEVRVREGKAVNIHMFCGLRPGLLLSTMMAMDRLGLDIQQAVISCFNGFAMDVFRAECKEGQDLNADQIKALLLDSAACHGIM
ncbi:transcription factor ICE1-like isoform X2 [Andrographis paniculata]|uniref:transcription factor ICE1-like isoform X2 n=1 Tax=Andrographis paniculata TaxID=175694 RepID=UPI0021E953D5|nr:transcription factor ICE1-like isoform X2 [Andrographis paniculata]